MTVFIKEWFLNKMEIPYYAIAQECVEVIKETEKAYYVKMETETVDGERDLTLNYWVPKKCTMTEDEYQDEIENAQKRFEDGCKKYEKLIQFCKDNGIKGVRVGLRKDTLLKKVAEAGLTYVW